VTAWTSTARRRLKGGRLDQASFGRPAGTLMDTENADIDEAAYLRAVAHPLRHRILAMLGERSSSPARLAASLGAKVNVVAYHVRRLAELGLADLIEVRRGRGGLEHVYAARRHPTFSDVAWEQLEPEERARVLVTGLRQLWEYVKRAAVARGFDRRDAHFTRTPLRVDDPGWQALAAATEDWLRAVDVIEREVARRGSDELFDAGLVILLFEAKPFSEPPARPASPAR
jgi:DNA-binding transcriptional ArsR family regulator